jgi:hypothetical protein
MTLKQILALVGLALALFSAYKALDRVRREFAAA